MKPEPVAPWLAPYAYGIVLLGIAFFLFLVLENSYASFYNKPLYRHLLVYKKLSASQVSILEKDFSFYENLSEKHKRQFRHRMAVFISEKKFVGRTGLEIDERMKILISAIGCMLSFGRKNYKYVLIDHILVYPEEFYSTINDNYHKGEFNPKERALVLSWKDFEEGFQITNDNLNVGIHEFMHAMQLEAKQGKDLDSARFLKHFREILKQLSRPEVKTKLEETKFFRMYAFTNQYEFMAVLAEYFFESPKELKSLSPELYSQVQKMLNFNFGGY